MKAGETACKYVSGGAGESWDVVGQAVTIKASKKDTEGVFTFFESVISPENGVPMHFHHREAEALYVLEGEFLVESNGKSRVSRSGDFWYFPKGEPHCWKNVGSRPGKVLLLLTPGGYEGFLEAMSKVDPRSPGLALEMSEVAREFDVEIIGPPPGGPSREAATPSN